MNNPLILIGIGIGILILISVVILLKVEKKCDSPEKYGSMATSVDGWVLYSTRDNGTSGMLYEIQSGLFNIGNNSVCVFGKLGSIVWNRDQNIIINGVLYDVQFLSGTSNINFFRDSTGNVYYIAPYSILKAGGGVFNNICNPV